MSRLDFDAINLRRAFRKKAIAHLERLHRRGELRLEGEFAYLQEEQAWQSFVKELEEVEWVSYIEPPPSERARPEHVVRYLSRYLTGGPISDTRITAADEQSVTFMARQGRTTGGDDLQVPVTLPTPEFVRRWCLHIQPSQLTKTRYFGGWSNQRRDAYLERCAILLDAEHPDDRSRDEQVWPPASLLREDHTLPACPHCNESSLRLIGEQPKPSWSQVLSFESPYCPSWYRQSVEQERRRWWDAHMGSGYSDWNDEYQKRPVEGAKALPSRPPPLVQRILPGMEHGFRLFD